MDRHQPSMVQNRKHRLENFHGIRGSQINVRAAVQSEQDTLHFGIALHDLQHLVFQWKLTAFKHNESVVALILSMIDFNQKKVATEHQAIKNPTWCHWCLRSNSHERSKPYSLNSVLNKGQKTAMSTGSLASSTPPNSIPSHTAIQSSKHGKPSSGTFCLIWNCNHWSTILPSNMMQT